EVGEHGLDRTTRILRLDLHTHKVSMLPGSQGLYVPRWSPDGRYVVATPVDNKNLMLFDFQAQKWSELVKGSSLVFPQWSSDSKSVAYLDFGPLAYFRVGINDHKIERVANLEQTRGLNAGRFWFYYGLAPDGNPLFLRNTGIQEIYSLDMELP